MQILNIHNVCLSFSTLTVSYKHKSGTQTRTYIEGRLNYLCSLLANHRYQYAINNLPLNTTLLIVFSASKIYWVSRPWAQLWFQVLLGVYSPLRFLSTSDKKSKWIIHQFFHQGVADWCRYLSGYSMSVLSRVNKLDSWHLVWALVTLWVTMRRWDNLIHFLPVSTGTPGCPWTRRLDVNIYSEIRSYFPSFFYLSSTSFSQNISSIFIISGNKGNNLFIVVPASHGK